MKMNCVNLISLLMLPTTMHHNPHTLFNLTKKSSYTLAIQSVRKDVYCKVASKNMYF